MNTRDAMKLHDLWHLSKGEDGQKMTDERLEFLKGKGYKPGKPETHSDLAHQFAVSLHGSGEQPVDVEALIEAARSALEGGELAASGLSPPVESIDIIADSGIPTNPQPVDEISPDELTPEESTTPEEKPELTLGQALRHAAEEYGRGVLGIFNRGKTESRAAELARVIKGFEDNTDPLKRFEFEDRKVFDAMVKALKGKRAELEEVIKKEYIFAPESALRMIINLKIEALNKDRDKVKQINIELDHDARILDNNTRLATQEVKAEDSVLEPKQVKPESKLPEGQREELIEQRDGEDGLISRNNELYDDLKKDLKILGDDSMTEKVIKGLESAETLRKVDVQVKRDNLRGAEDILRKVAERNEFEDDALANILLKIYRRYDPKLENREALFEEARRLKDNIRKKTTSERYRNILIDDIKEMDGFREIWQAISGINEKDPRTFQDALTRLTDALDRDTENTSLKLGIAKIKRIWAEHGDNQEINNRMALEALKELKKLLEPETNQSPPALRSRQWAVGLSWK